MPLLRFSAALLLACAIASPVIAEVNRPVRGVWLASVGSKSMMSPEGIQAAVERCKRSGINTIFVVTWNRGETLYPSRVMQKEFGCLIDPRLKGRDPLKELIDAAHAQDIQVIAWFEFGFSCSYRKSDGGHILQQRPDWAALDGDGDLVSRNGFQWMNAFDSRVQDFLLAMLKEVVANYDVDGVQGDDRLPALPNTGGYDPVTVSLYRADHAGADPPTDPHDTAWTQWRADRLSVFVERTYHELKAIDPELCVSWSPSVYPWSKQNYLQDWPRWVREGWGDLFCPQVYRRDLPAYRECLRQIAEEQVPAEKLSLIAPGMLIALADGYEMPSDLIPKMVAANREYGFESEVYFYYQGLEQHAEVFDTLYADAATITSDSDR
ncbi:MAG: family 10 glycosylhydrolase [Planctomycetota bacterium]